MDDSAWPPEYAEKMICSEFDPDGDVSLVFSETYLDSNDYEKSEEEDPVTLETETPSESLDEKYETESTRNEESSETSMLISSRHMVLASPVFKAMLSDRFKEGTDLRSTGKLRLHLPDDDPAALSIILQVIHGHPRKAPRQVTPSLFVTLAVLVDKYQLQEVMAMFTELWIAAIMDKKITPVIYGREIVQWLFVCFVFGQEPEFRRVTAVCQRESTTRISDDLTKGLAIPGSVIESIEKFRQLAIGSALATMRAIIEDYQGPTAQCPRHDSTIAFNCDGMVLGGVIKKLAKAGIWPEPQPPYNGHSFNAICQTLEHIEGPKYCKSWAPNCRYFQGKMNECLITSRRNLGLSLNEFKK